MTQYIDRLTRNAMPPDNEMTMISFNEREACRAPFDSNSGSKNGMTTMSKAALNGAW